MLTVTVDGRTVEIPLPDAEHVTREDVVRALTEAGVSSHVHVPTPEEMAEAERWREQVAPFIEAGRRAYRDAYNPNGPDAPPVCPYPEGSNEAALWWRGWNTQEALDAPDSE